MKKMVLFFIGSCFLNFCMHAAVESSSNLALQQKSVCQRVNTSPSSITRVDNLQNNSHRELVQVFVVDAVVLQLSDPAIKLARSSSSQCSLDGITIDGHVWASQGSLNDCITPDLGNPPSDAGTITPGRLLSRNFSSQTFSHDCETPNLDTGESLLRTRSNSSEATEGYFIGTRSLARRYSARADHGSFMHNMLSQERMKIGRQRHITPDLGTPPTKDESPRK